MSWESYIESGILELYVFGELDADAMQEVRERAAANPEIAAALAELEATLEGFAHAQSVAPPPRARQAWMDKLDEMEAEEKTVAEEPPVLTANSKRSDYAAWEQQPGVEPPAEGYEDLFFIPVSQTETGLTAIVWISGHVPKEIHRKEIEKFLVLEGACEIDIEGEVHQLKAGDFLSIPLHKWHEVRVTSELPCKLVVQRIAA